MNETINSSADFTTLKINDPLTIQYITPLYALLKESLNLTKELKIDHEKVDEFDLTYLQLLSSAHKTAANLKKKIKVDINSPVEFMKLTSEIGYADFLKNINIGKKNPTEGSNE